MWWQWALASYLLFFVIFFCAQMAEELMESPYTEYFLSSVRENALGYLGISAIWPLVGMTAVFYMILKHKKERKTK